MREYYKPGYAIDFMMGTYKLLNVYVNKLSTTPMKTILQAYLHGQ